MPHEELDVHRKMLGGRVASIHELPELTPCTLEKRLRAFKLSCSLRAFVVNESSREDGELLVDASQQQPVRVWHRTDRVFNQPRDDLLGGLAIRYPLGTIAPPPCKQDGT
jgi:hypothetical protein